MRLLHLSDWHLGSTLGRLSRAQDHDEVLEEMVDLAAEWRPHLIVHSGDLFDHSRPGIEDLQRGVEALRRLADTAPLVVLAGNHDSPALFDVFDRLLALGSRGSTSTVRFIGRARPPEQGGILTFPGEGMEELRLAAVPFVHPNAVLDAFDVPPQRRTAAYTDQVRFVEEALGNGLTAGYDGGRHILLFAAHLHVGGASFSGSERPLHITDIYATSVDHLPGVSYAAFGHIHKPQALPGGVVVGRYAGSPIQIDYGELGEQKSVVTVEALPGRPARVEVVPLLGGRPLRRVAGTLEALGQLRDVGRCILAATVDTEEPIADLAERIVAMFPAATIFDVVERCRMAQVELATESPDADAEPPVRDLFREYLSSARVPAVAVDRTMSVFGRLLEAVENETERTFDEEELFEPPRSIVEEVAG